MLRGGLTYSLWCTEGSEMILGEVGDEGGRLAISGPATGCRAAARRRRMITYTPISMATRTSPPMTPVENGSVRLEETFGKTRKTHRQRWHPQGQIFLEVLTRYLVCSFVVWWGLKLTDGRLGRIRVPHPVCLCERQIKIAVPQRLQRTYPVVQIRPVGDDRL